MTLSEQLVERLRVDMDALDTVRRYSALMDTMATLDDHDVESIFALFWEGLNAMKNAQPEDFADTYEEELKEYTVEELLTIMTQELASR